MVAVKVRMPGKLLTDGGAVTDGLRWDGESPPLSTCPNLQSILPGSESPLKGI